ncbi:hypothetical protein GE115_00120 [Agromyces sp. CFH 90414]|uniref:Uncharacterized protein n=1 Tax=Agromyces agglutinans TaxID=2662258 RepID=A0A6I2F783_9MICO|nr:hypothetical protein [Agromyces agglutinans]MRG58286.1 hypothetical protein [Agromyces agglutinans]
MTGDDDLEALGRRLREGLGDFAPEEVRSMFFEGAVGWLREGLPAGALATVAAVLRVGDLAGMDRGEVELIVTGALLEAVEVDQAGSAS